MNLQQPLPHRSSNYGFGRRRGEKEMSFMTDIKSSTKSDSSLSYGGKGVDGSARDRLIYVLTCLIGLPVEVHVKNGSVITGIFHGANAEADFGIVLKMARVIKDASVKGQKCPDIIKKPQTMIISSNELVQILAKDLSLSGDEFTNGNSHYKRQDLMIDSAISGCRQFEVGRELKPWTPDENDPVYAELQNVFDRSWNRPDIAYVVGYVSQFIEEPQDEQFGAVNHLLRYVARTGKRSYETGSTLGLVSGFSLEFFVVLVFPRNWDQFETNEALFGVRSTFDEELYTTKLEKGPQMREREREAMRIAREIQEEDTTDFHVAEERGIHLPGELDLDEEIRFSAVHRGVDDGRFVESEESNLDAYNTEAFEGSFTSPVLCSYPVIPRKRVTDEAQASTCSSADEDVYSHVLGMRDIRRPHSSDNVSQLEKGIRFPEEIKDQDLEKAGINDHVDSSSVELATSKSPDIQLLASIKSLSPNAAAFSPSGEENKRCSYESSETIISGKLPVSNEPVNVPRPNSSTSSASEHVGIVAFSSGPRLSPSSSLGSLSSEKSTLNPHAKEFKLNPNAKSFTPSVSVRASAPVSDGSFYYASGVSPVPHMHGMSVGIGIGPSFGVPQQVVYNPHPHASQMQSPQAYIHPNGPVYGQQMIIEQPRQLVYMPTYPPPEMQYKGRNF